MKWYKLIFKQIQPVHIGRGRYGILGETRIFIPGWTMWGALTKAYNLQKLYKVNENKELFTKITNFFPSFDKQIILHPEFKDGELHLGEYSERHFRAEFCNVLMSTAVNPLSRQATDTSLHELEFILPQGKNEKQQLYWIGLVRVEDTFSQLDFPKQIFVGGDSRYGYGLMELISAGEVNEDDLIEWQLTSDGQLLLKDNSKPCIHFTQWNKDLEAEGELELIPEFDFYSQSNEANYTINTQETGYFYVPGTLIRGFSDKNLSLYKGKMI